MGSGGAKVPPPPPLSAEERNFLQQQNLTLQDLRGSLSESRLQQKETQDVLKNLSGLYDEYETPEKLGDIKITRGDDINALGSYAKYNINLKSAREMKSKSEFFNRRASEVASDLVNSGVNENLTVQEAINLLQNKEEALKYGFAERSASTPGGKEFRINQKALNTLRGKLDKYQEQEDRFNADLNEIGTLQAERLKSALRGELPVSEGTRQRKSEEFQILKEAISRQGSRIDGDTPESAVARSTAGNEVLGGFNRNYKLIEDAERRGEIAAGSNPLGQTLSLTGSPGAQSLGFLQSAGTYNPMNLAGGYTGLLQGYGQAMQPYSNQRLAGYNAQVQNAALRSQGMAGLTSLLGYGGGAAFSAGNPWLGGTLIGAGALFGR